MLDGSLLNYRLLCVALALKDNLAIKKLQRRTKTPLGYKVLSGVPEPRAGTKTMRWSKNVLC